MSRAKPEIHLNDLEWQEVKARAKEIRELFKMPPQTSAAKMAMIHGEYYDTATGDRVTAYSVPISLC